MKRVFKHSAAWGLLIGSAYVSGIAYELGRQQGKKTELTALRERMSEGRHGLAMLLALIGSNFKKNQDRNEGDEMTVGFSGPADFFAQPDPASK